MAILHDLELILIRLDAQGRGHGHLGVPPSSSPRNRPIPIYLYDIASYSREAVEGWVAIGSVEQIVEKLKRYEALGFNEATLRITSWDQRAPLDRLINEVLPHFAECRKSVAPRLPHPMGTARFYIRVPRQLRNFCPCGARAHSLQCWSRLTHRVGARLRRKRTHASRDREPGSPQPSPAHRRPLRRVGMLPGVFPVWRATVTATIEQDS